MNRTPNAFLELASRGVACATLMLFCGGSFAQDALRSALEGNTAYRARTASTRPATEHLSIGPVNLRATVSYGLEWTDNVRLTSTNVEADFNQTVQANLHAAWSVTEDSTLNFGLGVGYQVYAQNSDLNRFSITPDSELAWDISVQDFVFTLYDRFSDSQEVISQGAISGTATFPRIENTAGLRARWYPAQYAFELGYGHYNFISDGGEFDYLSRHSEQFFGSAGWRFATATVAGVEVSASLTDYDQALQSDNHNVSAGPFVEWQVTPWFSLSLHGGLVYYSFASPLPGGNADSTSYYVNFDARHRATDFLTHGLTLRRDVQQGLNQGSQTIEQLTTRYSIAWAFHRSASLSTGVWYEHGREPQIDLVEEFDRYGLDFGLTTQPLRHFQAGLSYRYTLRDSNENSRDYRQNVVAINLSYVF